MTPILDSQVLILGTGIAGLSAALKFAKTCKVVLVSKADRAEGATRYAQGGIASVWSKQDSFEEHKQDTLTAGAGLCDPEIVDICVTEGPARVQELIDLGVEFTKANLAPDGASDPTEVFDLHREGGHGRRRILHADDLTGWAIEKALLNQIANTPQIVVLENHVAIDLITEGKLLKKEPGKCLGAYILNISTGEVLTLAADVTVLATGGAGKVYLYTSNPDIATGDGIAMAYRAGAEVANLEFMQFHPTCLYHPSARTFLISEALRGEGAILKTIGGDPFMNRYHPMASLAPRDIVARAIDMEMKRTGDKHVLLDCSAISEEDLRRKFPNIYEFCREYGIDITLESIPVVPAAHYSCGGVKVNQYAQTTVDALYAVGEVACTGLHGANRLASNSLLEAVVFAHRAVEHALPLLQGARAERTVIAHKHLPEWDTGHAVELEEQIDIAANWLEIRHLMWNYVGIVRSNRRLERAERRIQLLKDEVNAYYWNFLLTRNLIELRNLLTVADLTVKCALMRKESRGLHYTGDFPKKDDSLGLIDSVIKPL
ncbi:MAG: L-aspartate oxidase [Bdellovibrionia bacterium]